MNNQDHDASRGGGGEKGGGGDVTTPSSGSATATNSGGGAAPSASTTTNQHQQNSSANTNVSTNANTNTSGKTSNTNYIYSNSNTSNTVNAHNASMTTANMKGGGARGSSTESESAARREYGERRRLANVPSDDEDDDEDIDDEEEDEEEEEDDEEDEHGARHGLAHDSEGESSHRSSLSGHSRGPPTPRVAPQNPGQNASQSLDHSHTSSSSGSPVRRLPSMLRPPMGSQQQLMQGKAAAQAYGTSNGRGYDMGGAASSPTLYGLHPRQHQAQYYEPVDARYASNGNSQMSPRDASPSSGAMAMDGSRGMAQKRRLNQSGEYGPSSQPPMPASNPTARTIYEASQHHTSSNSSSSTARSGGNSGGNSGSSGMSGSRQHAGEDDGNDDPLRFETRGSHGPRDEARYETWTSKQLRKKCSHLKLRGLKNVKKHVMVEALYRYYRNQRGKQTTDGGSSTMRGSSTTSGGHNTSNGNNNNTSGSHGERGASSSLNDGSQSSRRFHDAYAQSSSQRYEHVANASTSSSNYLANAVAASLLRGNRSSGGSTSQQQQHIARRSSPSSSTGLTMRPAQRSSSVGGGEGRNADYDAPVDLEESKYDSQPNEMRITSEDVIRLVDVILSPEFVDRLTGELSRWQFWVDIREKYVSLVSSNSASSYGAARSLTALGGDRHQHQPGQGERSQGGNSGASVDRVSMNSGYVRPSAKWSSMQLWEMWKELTFAYTKTCFEFTAAGVDERNYIQFCEGRPDVYYLHQRLHARPDLLHLIKSNEYIEEKCSSDVASEHTTMTAEKNAANTLMGVGTPGGQRPHKRFKRIVPAGSVGGNGSVSGGAGGGASVSGSVPNGGPAPSSSSNYKTGPANADGTSGKTGSAPVNGGCDSGNASGDSSGDNGVGRELTSQNAAAAGGRAPGNNSDARQYLAANGMRGPANDSPSGQPEEGSTENSETTGEDNSVEKSNSNTTSDSTRREALAEQKYFGLLLQNFEAIFESLHNKKVLLAALRKDSGAPDHLIADLHDDIHVLSALKKDFRNKLRQALE